ncbi:MAG: peroxiredoxin family protein [Pseudomonadales bacterium]|nr:peroxiredoxin family protein [Pseudomonadales bacterium]
MNMVIRKQAFRFLFSLLFASLASISATAERKPILVADLGPQIGEQVPEFRLPDQNGQTHSLDSIMGPNGAMLLFHRSADW